MVKDVIRERNIPDVDTSDADVACGCSRRPPVLSAGSQTRVSVAPF